MNIFDEINLPQSSKHMISLDLKKGGTLDSLGGTNAYISKLKKKESIFLGEFTPLTPYMYGIVFSNQKYWSEILKELNLKHVWKKVKGRKKILFLITREGFYNAVLEKGVVVTGNGKDNIKTLVKNENIKRINSKNNYVMPIRVVRGTVKLGTVLKAGETVGIPENYDHEDVSNSLDKNIVKSVKRIIDFLPGLPFLRLEIYIKNLDQADKLSFGRVLISPGVNVFFRHGGRSLLSPGLRV